MHKPNYCLSILSRFYFILIPHAYFVNFQRLSILSRFYFIIPHVNNFLIVHSSFQSYQGSILSGFILDRGEKGFTFNPIKVLFYRNRRQGGKKTWITFNPIKVLFYHYVCCIVMFIFDIFQSYQGSILSVYAFSICQKDRNLSILSRFYFIWRQNN